MPKKFLLKKISFTFPVFLVFNLMSCAINSSVSSEITPTTPATSVNPTEPIKVAQQENSDPRAVVDEFYNAYINQNISWQELEDYLDPNTYEQLSQLKAYDSDPFTNTQERVFDYLIESSEITDNTAEVEVRFQTGIREPSPDFGRSLTVVLSNNNDQWQIQNIIYSPEPLPSGAANDLLHGWMENQRSFYPNQTP